MMKCPLCSKYNTDPFEINTQEAKTKKKCLAIKCDNCGLSYLEDYLKDRTYIYNEEYYVFAKSEEKNEPIISEAKKETFRYLLNFLLKHINTNNKKLLDVGTAKGYLLDVASKMGFDCYGVEISKYTSKKAEEKFPNKIFNGTLEEANYRDNQFDIITIIDLVEHLGNLNSFFDEVNRVIKPNGLILFTVPHTESFTKKILNKNWFNYKYEHVTYWNKRALRYLSNKHNFGILKMSNNKKRFNLLYYYQYLKKYSIFGIEKLFFLIYKFIPNFLKKKYFNNPITGELLVIMKKNEGE